MQNEVSESHDKTTSSFQETANAQCKSVLFVSVDRLFSYGHGVRYAAKCLGECEKR